MSDVEMEATNEDVANQSDDSSGDSDTDCSDDDREHAAQQAELVKEYCETLEKISNDKYNYNNYVALLEIAYNLVDLEKIRQSVEIFAAVYPLSPEIWLRRLKVEVSVAATAEQLAAVVTLFERALGDYFSAKVAQEFARFAMKSPKEISNGIWDVLIPTYALHTTEGRDIFEMYREDMLTKDGDSSESLNRLARIYEKELKIPLRDMENSYIEYKLLCEKHKSVLVDLDMEKFERRYRQAKEALQKMLPFEDKLAALESHRHQERAQLYQQYIADCKSDLDDDEVQILYERMVTECCLNANVWISYLRYLRICPPDPDDNAPSPVFGQTELDLVNRALRNCTWSAELYVEKMRILERLAKAKEEVMKVIEEVSVAELQTPESAVKVWLEYLTYLRRHTNFENGKEMDILRNNFQLAWNQLGGTWGAIADPECKILQFWGRLEYELLGEPMKGRDLWHSVMESSDNSTRVGLWIEFAELESKRGSEPVRKLYRKAIHSPGLNDPETLAAAWLRFERIYGNLEQLVSCQEVCTAKVEEYYNSLRRQRKKPGRKSDGGADESSPSSTVKGSPKKAEKRTQEQADLDEAGGSPFKRPTVPIGPLAPGLKQSKGGLDNMKKLKLDGGEQEPTKQAETTSDRSKDGKRVFFSNLSFEATEEAIRANFPELAIKSIDLALSSSGKSRGFGYVELETEEEIAKALSFDRRPLAGRPVFISNLAREKKDRSKQFKYAEKFEPNKLFIKGLPFEAGTEDLRRLFEPFGKIKDIRLVYFRSGKSKGLAYLEYETEAAAKNAVLQMDQYEMSGFTINVALSAPPPKANPTQTEPAVAGPSLGGGKRLTKSSNNVRTKISSFIPAALLKKQTIPVAPKETPKSNEDFRKLLTK